MKTKDVITELRTKYGLTQEELAEKSVCYKTSGVSLGDGRNGAEYRNVATVVEVV